MEGDTLVRAVLIPLAAALVPALGGGAVALRTGPAMWFVAILLSGGLAAAFICNIGRTEEAE